MLHGSFLGDTDSRTDPAAPGGSLPRHPVAIGESSVVSDAAFALEVTQGQERKTIEFLIDGNTKVEGKLEIGSHATVEYRAADGKNVAVHVVVAPASGLEAR
jgi:UDP-3-O-[3-hydroxymyristoyl] glucosamine N-acyltransferase